MPQKKIWQVNERSGREAIVGQRRCILATSRKEAKAVYEQKYKKYRHTRLVAIVVGSEDQWRENDGGAL